MMIFLYKMTIVFFEILLDILCKCDIMVVSKDGNTIAARLKSAEVNMANHTVAIKINKKAFDELKKKYNQRDEVIGIIFKMNVTDIKKGKYAIAADTEETEDIKKCIIGETITEDIQGTTYIYAADIGSKMRNRLKFIRQYGYDKDETDEEDE